MGWLWQRATLCTHQPALMDTAGWVAPLAGRVANAPFLVSNCSKCKLLPFYRTQNRLGLTRSHLLAVSEAKACLA